MYYITSMYKQDGLNIILVAHQAYENVACLCCEAVHALSSPSAIAIGLQSLNLEFLFSMIWSAISPAPMASTFGLHCEYSSTSTLLLSLFQYDTGT